MLHISLHVCVVCRQDVFVGYCDIKESAVLSEWSHDYAVANSDVFSLLQFGFTSQKGFLRTMLELVCGMYVMYATVHNTRGFLAENYNVSFFDINYNTVACTVHVYTCAYSLCVSTTCTVQVRLQYVYPTDPISATTLTS